MVEGLIPWCGELGTFQYYIIQYAIQSNVVKTSLGDLSGRGTPGPISNPVVKPVSADGTWRATSWESRSLPRGFQQTPTLRGGISVLDNTCRFMVQLVQCAK